MHSGFTEKILEGGKPLPYQQANIEKEFHKAKTSDQWTQQEQKFDPIKQQRIKVHTNIL